MVDPYRMVFVNIISIILLFLGIIFYVYIFPKKKINLSVLLLLVSIPPILSLLRAGDYESGDFNIHIYRAMAFYDALKDGIFMPSWAEELNATYGYPLFIFNYAVPYYFISFFHLLGFSFISAMKIYLGLIYFFSGIFIYLWVKELTEDKLAAFTAAVFYLFNPYHLIDIHFRASVGESTIFTIAPIIFYSITKCFKEKKSVYLIVSSLSSALLFLSHALLAGVFIGIAAVFILFLGRKNIRFILLSLGSLLTGTVTAIYSWIPFILYTPHTLQQKLLTSELTDFYPFSQLFYSPWRFGLLFQGPKGELGLIVGYAQIFVLMLSIFLLLKKKVPKKIKGHLFFWLFSSMFFLFLMNPLSGFLWKFLSFLRSLLPTGRLSLAVGFSVSVLAAYFALVLIRSKSGKFFLYLILIATIVSTILNWGHRRVIPQINDQTLKKNLPLSTASGEGHFYANSKYVDPKNPWLSKLPENPLEIIDGKGDVKEIRRTSVLHAYKIDASTPITIRENTLYFPGWSSKINNKQVTLYPDSKGVINAKLPKGKHLFELSYQDITSYKISKMISVTLFFISLFLLLFQLLIPFSIQKNRN